MTEQQILAELKQAVFDLEVLAKRLEQLRRRLANLTAAVEEGDHDSK